MGLIQTLVVLVVVFSIVFSNSKFSTSVLTVVGIICGFVVSRFDEAWTGWKKKTVPIGSKNNSYVWFMSFEQSGEWWI